MSRKFSAFRSARPTCESFVTKQKPLNFPTPAISSQAASILSFVPAIPAVRSNYFDAVTLEARIQPVGVISIVTDQILWGVRHNHSDQRILDQFHFVRCSACDEDRDRKSVPVCHGHDFSSLTTFGLSNLGARFLAGAKLPSMKASLTSSRRSSASASKMPRMMPDPTHC